MCLANIFNCFLTVKTKVGDCDAIRGVLDDVKYHIFGMKEPDYVMKIMATYSGLTVLDGQKESVRK